MRRQKAGKFPRTKSFHSSPSSAAIAIVLTLTSLLSLSFPSPPLPVLASEQGCAPFGNGIDAFGFYNNIDQAEAQRFADVEITHGRVAMLAALGFFVGEQVEGSAFLFDASVTGPAINHFQQVPTFFAVTLGVGIILAETNRVNQAWQSPFEASRLFLQKDSHVPGDYAWDPLGLSKGKSANDMKSIKMKELNNGRLAMVAIAGLVGQELVDGQNVFQSGVDAAAAQ